MQIFLFILLATLSYAITALMAPKPSNTTTPTAINDIKFPIATEGTPQAVIFGDCWTTDWMVLWVGNYRTEEIHTSSGGKK